MKKQKRELNKKRAETSRTSWAASLLIVFWATAASAQVGPPPPPPAKEPPPPALRIRTGAAHGSRVPRRCRCRSCRCPKRSRRVRSSRHKAGPYFGLSGGTYSLLKAKGAYQYLQEGGHIGTHFGWAFREVLSLELGFSGGMLREKEGYLGGVKSPSLLGLTLDFRFRFAEPDEGAKVVPYLQSGLGVYFLQGRLKNECGEYEEESTMAFGGGFQLGGGVDIYLNRFLTLGLRVMYRPLLMSNIECGPGSEAVCAAQDPQGRNVIHAISTGLTLTLRAPFL